MKILGIDYGKKKVGVAMGDTDTKLVEPITTVNNLKFLIFNLKSILNNQIIEKVVIGNPGGNISKEIEKFGQELKKQTNIQVEYFDETLTTQEAQKVLIESGNKRKSRNNKEDAVAAALMLQWYFDSCGC